MTTITIVGNLGTDPELRFTPSGDAVCKLSVGTSRRYRDESGEWKDGNTSWHDVTAWRHLAEHCAESLQKGSRVVVVGELEQRSWEDKDSPGKKRYGWQVTARNIAVDLTFGTAAFTKSAKGVQDPNDPWATASRQRPAAGAPATHTGAPAQHSGPYKPGDLSPAAAWGVRNDEPPF